MTITAATSELPPRMARRSRRRTKAASPIGVERLEARELLAATPTPFGPPEFRAQFAQILADNGIPQGAIALTRDGQTFDYQASNPAFFGGSPPPLSAGSLFRVGSVTKAFTAAAIARLWQDGKLDLDSSAFASLGYRPGTQVAGLDPVTGAPVSADLPAPLFNITARDLLQMISGLPTAITLASATFPDAAPAQALYTDGSYAALAFAGKPPYQSPATAEQQVRYTVYEIAAHYDANAPSDPSQPQGTNELEPAGLSYSYNDTNYAILGLIAADLAQSDYGLSYMDYLQTYVLGPMGISPPMAEPVTNDAMVGLGSTLRSQAYPTEVSYYSYPGEKPAHGIFPDPEATSAPFYPPDDFLPLPYGGEYWMPSHFGDGGLVATPSALTKFFTNLNDSLSGQVDGPLTQKTVAAMAAQPAIGPDLPGGGGWFGMGFYVYSGRTGDQIAWTKDGDFAGCSAVVNLDQNGSAWAAEFNIDVLGAKNPHLNLDLEQLVNEAASWPAAIAATSGGGQSAATGATFSRPFRAAVTDTFGAPVVGAKVTFISPSTGAGGTFAGGVTSVTVVTDAQGIATSPAFTANASAGTYTVSAVTEDNPARGQFTATFRATNHPPGKLVAVGAHAGSDPWVTLTDAGGNTLGRFRAYGPKFHGEVKVATGDLNGDGVDDVVTAPGRGARPIKVYDGRTGALLQQFSRPGRPRGEVVGVAVKDVDGRPGVVATLLTTTGHPRTRTWAWPQAGTSRRRP